jgi:hypothetical protein
MKLKSLILGSIAAAGLSTAGFAADLGVLTSLDVCDELGLSGLTISSDENCLQISGEVKYEFNWGDYSAASTIAATSFLGNVNIDDNGSTVGVGNDWESRVQSWLKFVGTQGSDFGPASAVIKLKHDDRVRVRDGGNFINPTTGLVFPNGIEQRETGNAVVIDEAYVQVGDTTVLTAGKRGSIFNKGDDEPFNFTGLFISQRADTGVVADENADIITPKRGGHFIQLWSNIGEGLIAKIGLENLNSAGATTAAGNPLIVGGGPAVTGAQKAGTLVGVLDYAGSGITAHISGAVGGLLDGVQTSGDSYLLHTGVTATFDAFRFVALSPSAVAMMPSALPTTTTGTAWFRLKPSSTCSRSPSRVRLLAAPRPPALLWTPTTALALRSVPPLLKASKSTSAVVTSTTVPLALAMATRLRPSWSLL